MKTIVLIVFCSLLANAIGLHERLNFDLTSEWNLIPDETGRLRMYHFSEIKTTAPENFFVAETDMRFLLFTQKNPTIPQIVSFDADPITLEKTNFNVSNPTKFTIHGWNANINAGVNVAVTRQYLSTGDHNIFVVDWSKGAETNNYIDARNRVRDVGRVVGRLIDNLVVSVFLNIKDVMLIGHSLGGHACGMAAKNALLGKVGAIIALDPAGPLFTLEAPHDRVDVDDGDYVEVIHTSAVLGFFSPIGDSDFYPNGGRSQPGCGIDIIGTCAHSRAHQFFAESITSELEFYANLCNDMTQLGNVECSSGTDIMGGKRSARGIYHLRTSDSSPFALGPM